MRRGSRPRVVRGKGPVSKPVIGHGRAGSAYGEYWDTVVSPFIRKRDNYTCQAHKIGLPRCFRRFAPPLTKFIHAHHIVPRNKGGRDHPSNGITLCWECHGKEHGKVVGAAPSKKQLKYADQLNRR